MSPPTVAAILRRSCGLLAGLTLAPVIVGSWPIIPDRVLAATPPGIAYDARIRRDTFGVPHVIGKTDADAAYGLGFAQSEDDFATVQESIFASRGQLAALKGESAILSDTLFALMDVEGALNGGYERDLPAHVRGILDGYAEGVNRYAALHPQSAETGLLPVTGRDLAAFTLFRSPTFYGLDTVFAEVASGKLQPPHEQGSNGLAVAPSRSADGHTRLLFNAHQPWTGPLTFYEAVVQSDEGWHVAGGFFPANPFLLGGHNAHLGWAATVNHPKLADVYRLTLNPADPNQYLLDGQWKTLERRVVDIRVKQKDGSLKIVTRDLQASTHGPVIKGPQGAFAIRWPTQGGAGQLAEYYAMNMARDLTEWKAAMALRKVPSINYIYADEKGNIGYLSNGMYPARKEGPDWSGVLPGDRSDLVWTTLRPFSQSPQIWNPKSGWVFNSNNTPFAATDPNDDLKPSDYPASMTLQPPSDMTNRAWRAIETYGADPSITAEAFDAYKYDLAYSRRSDEVAWVKAVLDVDPAGDADLAAAQTVLRVWDGRSDLHNRGQALVAVMWLERRQHKDWTPVQMLKAAIALIKASRHRVDPEWGEVNRLTRGKVDLPLDGGPDVYRAVYGAPGLDGRLHGVNGDGYVMFMDWDKAGRLTSRSVHQFGSSTQDQTSSHYADQSPLFAAHKTKPVLFTEADLRGHIQRDYRPSDGEK